MTWVNRMIEQHASSPDWADEKAREWWDGMTGPVTREAIYSSLAAMLREVAQHSWSEVGKAAQLQGQAQGRGWVLAEVRRVVEGAASYAKNHPDQSFMAGHRYACEEILARLEKLGE